jgi:hypothetical protein
MKSKQLLSALLIALFLSSTLPQTARADEGMWPFNHVPKGDIKRKYGFDVTDAWLKKVQLASVRFNSGGSGSFVSADGLVMTNHHVAADTLQKISTAQKDYIKDGFYAPTRDKEVRAPDLELNQLISIEDVTDRVNAAVTPGMSTKDANDARRAASSAIEQESTAATGLRSDVVTLYQGGQYNLYRYKKYTDVRLVFAPEFEIAFLGGDPDNFTYPRYDLDLALFHVYENGQPVRPENYFKWSKNGSRAGELVFISGNPATTARLNTVAHLEFLRDTELPFTIKALMRRQANFHRFSERGAEQERRAHQDLFSIENSLKRARGQLAGLKDRAVMLKKQRGESELRRAVAADPRKRKAYADAWDAIAAGRKGFPAYYLDYRFLELGNGFDSRLFIIARNLVRLAAENTKPDADRLPEYTGARRASLELALYSPAPIYDDFEKTKLADSLAFMQEQLGSTNQTVLNVLHDKSPEARASDLLGSTKLKDVAFRKELAAGGVEAIEKSNDPMIVLARSIDGEARAVRKRYEDEVLSVERANYAKIARAVFDLKGASAYPDATFTPRLSYGTVTGYRENGRMIAPFTTFAGLFQHSAEHGDKFPYHVPASWVTAKSSLDLQTPINLVASTDSHGGNSGSPLINRNAEIVGLLFDGNIQSLAGNFVYDITLNRSVFVDSRGMIEALRKVYHANEVARELAGE